MSNSSWIYTFLTKIILNIVSGMRVKDPFLDSSVTGGTIDAGTKVILSCDTPGSRIFYTTDGSPPELHQESVKVCTINSLSG